MIKMATTSPGTVVSSSHPRKEDLRPFLSTDSVLSLPSSHFHTIGPSRIRLSEASRMCASLSEPCGGTGGSTDLPAGPVEWRHHSRPALQGSLSSSSSEERIGLPPPPRRGQWEGSSFGKSKPAAGAPDLVMDLPVAPLSSSPKDHANLAVSPRLYRCDAHVGPTIQTRGRVSPGTHSPERAAMTAAECFAKQNQSTLKKAAVVTKSLSCSAVGSGGGSSDAQTQTLAPPIKVSTSISTDTPPSLKDGSSSEEELCIKETSPTPSVSAIVKNFDSVIPQIESEQHQQSLTQHSEDVMIEVRAAADMVASDVIVAPSTPKLAARYLKAVAASGGGSGVAVKPQVRVKPTVLKKPSLPPTATDPELSKFSN